MGDCHTSSTNLMAESEHEERHEHAQTSRADGALARSVSPAVALPPLLAKRMHRRQTGDWDCGVACVYSLLLHLGAPTLRYADLLSCVLPCEQRVWTIDLALLLHAFDVRGVRMRSTRLGADPAHAEITFYDKFERDAHRVARAFKEAERRGMDVKQSSLSSSDVHALLLSGHVLLMLVDHRFLSCTSCCTEADRMAAAALPEFLGHFVLLLEVGTSAGDEGPLVRYLDPAVRHAPCTLPLLQLEVARRSAGTDEDVLVIPLRDNVGHVPVMSRTPAVGFEESDGSAAAGAAGSAASP